MAGSNSHDGKLRLIIRPSGLKNGLKRQGSLSRARLLRTKIVPHFNDAVDAKKGTEVVGSVVSVV